MTRIGDTAGVWFKLLLVEYGNFPSSKVSARKSGSRVQLGDNNADALGQQLQANHNGSSPSEHPAMPSKLGKLDQLMYHLNNLSSRRHRLSLSRPTFSTSTWIRRRRGTPMDQQKKPEVMQ